MDTVFRKPVEQDEVYEVTIDAVGEKGDGIAKVEGFVVFVPGTQKGDKVKVKVTKVLRKFALGEVVGESETGGLAPSEDAPEEKTEDVSEEDSEETGSEETEEDSEETESEETEE